MTAKPKHHAWVALATLGLSSPQVAVAAPTISEGHEARLAACIREAASGRGWLEKTLWGLRDKEAGWIGAEILNTNGTHDLGPLQINSSWVPKLAKLVGRPPEQIRFWLIHDPCFNVQAARWIFLAGLNATGNYWKAVGVYHSPTEWRQRRYIQRVTWHLEKRFGQNVFAVPGAGKSR
ncbi:MULTISPECIES: lytic transglycosylase domain-containing protein [unclassified Sphingobium]|uniref:lytic transglycosylase domain-containing protein n=1 Tax=unclassified Sphingobium TaxID=2611147 RepID=UPI002224F4E0|nr:MULTISPECIES: lytic transglycosylase domain-containing protein [unclassified Sphingobium]MCW2384594.1 hypothetical protein [Sphingobium sp. B2D3D]